MIIVDIIKNENATTDESVYTLRGTTHLKRRVIPIMTLLHSSTRTTGGYGKLNPTKNHPTTPNTDLSSLEHFYRGGRVHTQPL